ncbi:hypothetical protein SNE40_003268 [Patella caerulea]|uniref:TRAFD1/XAF1 zinc finger domain-containing protein n=1 Tax=Patella caerulea TaxID=87958 RepID=A0AAN8K7I0_PATCE
MSEDEQYCNNCKKNIASTNFVMHEMHCKRHIILCKKCNEPVPRSEEEEHFESYHAEIGCDLCKMKVEKSKLEHHMEAECLSKPKNCAFCELQMPQCDLPDHESYCGTRTEPCASCDQYIMIKDFTLHLESGCQYPTPKPPPAAPSYRSRRTDFNDPFSFDEIHRFLDDADVPSFVQIGSDNQFMGASSFGRRGDRLRNNTSDRTRKNTTNRKSEVNRQNELSNSPPDTSYDSMLSQLLSASQNPADDLTQYVETIQKQSNPPVLSGTEEPGSNSNINRYYAEDQLPCEFCGDLFPPTDIIQHQSGCEMMISGEWSSINPAITTNSSESRNNEVPTEVHRSTAFIPVINNLHDTEQWQSPVIHEAEVERVENNDNVYDDDVYGDDVMLPCEFCTDLFPSQMLVIHQSICDANTTVTPRVQTPVSTYKPKLRKNTSHTASYLANDNFNSSRSSRRQGPPSDLGDYETLQNNNELSEQYFPLNYDVNKRSNGHSHQSYLTSSGNKRMNSTSEVRRTSVSKHKTSESQKTLENLLNDDPDQPFGLSSRNVGTRNLESGASGGAVAQGERRNKTSVSAKKVYQEIEKKDKEASRKTNKRLPSTRNFVDDNRESNGESSVPTRQRSTHLLNADHRTGAAQPKPKTTTVGIFTKHKQDPSAKLILYTFE